MYYYILNICAIAVALGLHQLLFMLSNIDYRIPAVTLNNTQVTCGCGMHQIKYSSGELKDTPATCTTEMKLILHISNIFCTVSQDINISCKLINNHLANANDFIKVEIFQIAVKIGSSLYSLIL